MEASRQDSKGLAALGGVAKRNLGSAGRWIGPRLRGRRGTELATIVALVGGMLMVVAEFLDLFEVTATDGATIDSATVGSNHGYALLVIGVMAVLGVIFARSTEQWQPAAAAAALAGVGLLVLLIGDLPETVRSGLTDSAKIGDASPAIGFWIALIATLMTIGGSAATAWALRARDAGEQ